MMVHFFSYFFDIYLYLVLVRGIDRSTEKVRIPFEKIKLFGRSSEIERLCDHFLNGSSADASAMNSNMAVITGTSGIGKTSLAICVAYELQPYYLRQHFFQASTLDVLKEELVRFARVHLIYNSNNTTSSNNNNVADDLATALEYLKTHFSWLLVIDDVTNATEVIEYFTPIVEASNKAAAEVNCSGALVMAGQRGGAIILTTQTLLPANSFEIQLQGLTRDSAVELLKKLNFRGGKIEIEDYSDPIVSKFLDEVTGNHPLAVTQVFIVHLSNRNLMFCTSLDSFS